MYKNIEKGCLMSIFLAGKLGNLDKKLLKQSTWKKITFII